MLFYAQNESKNITIKSTAENMLDAVMNKIVPVFYYLKYNNRFQPMFAIILHSGTLQTRALRTAKHSFQFLVLPCQ